MKKNTYYTEIVSELQELHALHPSLSFGQHIASLSYEYGDLWGISDKELAFALCKYRTTLEIDSPHKESDIQDIIKEGMSLDTILEQEEEEY